jgi:hypothetical protein
MKYLSTKFKQTSAFRGTTIGGPGKHGNGARRINSSSGLTSKKKNLDFKRKKN